jgi:AraC-like DNA-binding protein
MPDSEVLTITDPYEHQQAYLSATVELFVTQPGRYLATHTRINLHKLRIQRGEHPLGSVSYAVAERGRAPIYFPTEPKQASHLHSGLEVSCGQLVQYSDGPDYHKRSSSQVHWGAMSLRVEDLAAALAGYELTPPKANSLVRPPPTAMQRLLGLHKAAGDLAATAPEILTHPEVAKAIEQELTQIMVRCLIDGDTTSANASAHTRLPVMRRFEQFLEQHPDKPLYVAEICAAIGASGRTLRHHCLEYLELSPHRYLWLRRMNLAKRALTVADAVTTTVTQIATDHGFWELGRFAVAYRKLFGESPSATLRRPPDHIPLSQVPFLHRHPR